MPRARAQGQPPPAWGARGEPAPLEQNRPGDERQRAAARRKRSIPLPGDSSELGPWLHSGTCEPPGFGPRSSPAGRPSVADGRPIPVLRPPRRRVPGGQRAPRPGGLAGRPEHGAGLRRQGRLAHVPRERGPRLSPAPAPRVRDGDDHPPRSHRPLRLARGDGALRARRRAVAHGRRRHRALRDVPAHRPVGAQPARALPDLAQPPPRGQARRSPLRDAVERGHPAPYVHRRRGQVDGRDRGGRVARRPAPAVAASAIVGVPSRRGRRHLDDLHGARRDVDAPAGHQRERRAHPLLLPRSVDARGGPRALVALGRGRPQRRRDGARGGRRARATSCSCRASRSGSPSCSTARSS